MPTGFLPFTLKFDDRACLVVGGGEVGQRKARRLLAAGARVELLSAEIDDELRELAATYPANLTIRQAAYGSGDLSPYQLVFAATDDAEINNCISADAKRAGVPVNVVDTPALCSFYVPATMQRGDLQVAVTTGGSSPALAARIRQELEASYPEYYAAYSRALGRVREWLRSACPDDEEKRRAVLLKLAARETGESLRELDEEAMVKRMQEMAGSLGAPAGET